MDLKSDLSQRDYELAYRLNQTLISISVEEGTPFPNPTEMADFIRAMTPLICKDNTLIPRSPLVEEVRRLGPAVIEEKLIALDLAYQSKRPKRDVSIVLGAQINFFSRPPEPVESLEPAKGTAVAVSNLCQAFLNFPIDHCKTLLESFDVKYINKPDEKTDDTPLLAAVMSAKSSSESLAIEKVNLLLERNADVNGRNPCLSTALHNAASLGLEVMCNLLVSRGANVFSVNKDGLSPIDRALNANHVSLAISLFSQLKGDLINFLTYAHPSNKITILHRCVRNDALLEFTKMILPYHNSPELLEARNSRGQTPLLSAVVSDSFKSVVELLKHKASILAEVADIDHQPPLNVDLMNLPYFVGATVLHLAHFKLLQYLLTEPKRPDVNAANNIYACTPLHSAVIVFDFNRVVLLCRHGAKPELRNDEGQNAVHIAAMRPLTNVLDYLVDKNCALLLDQDKYGMTPGHWAALKGNNDMAKHILMLAKRNNILDALLVRRATAEKVVVMGITFRIKGCNLTDLLQQKDKIETILSNRASGNKECSLEAGLDHEEYFANKNRLNVK